MADQLTPVLWSKVSEQLERLAHLLSLVPSDRISWRPPILDGGEFADGSDGSKSQALPLLSLGELLGHLLDCLSGFCAALHKVHPVRLQHLAQLRALPVNHFCGVEEASQRVAHYRVTITEGFAHLTDQDLARVLPTVFAPAGEPALAFLLGNLEHLINHKAQLFIYLRLLGVPVSSRDLYHFREIAPA